VPVNSAGFPTQGTDRSVIIRRLNEIYGAAVVSWNVHIDNPIEVGRINEEDFKAEGTALLSKYTSDMNRVIRAYKRDRVTDDNTMYLFFMEIPNLGSHRKGFMPLSGNYGFIFNFEAKDLELIAHELAHGAFNLRHTFSDKAQHYFPQNQTANLMDYAGGTELWKYQWDLIHNPESILFAWAQDEEEGAMMNLNMSEESIKGVINLIRESNIAKEKTVDLSIFSLSKGGSVNLKLTDNFTLEYVEVSIGSGKYIGNQDIPFLFEPLTIKPMELKCVKIANPPLQREDFVHISFNRFDQAAPPRMGIVESDSVGISFIVKLSQKDEFEAYLKNELYAKAIWVSQFDETVFRDCTCFPQRACCFYASQYIVKNSTKLYSPNGNQIATMRFPINDAPLISMQTPMSIPSGFKSGVAYLDASLAEGKPIVVGVYYRGRQELQQRRTAEAQERLNAAQENLNALIEEIEMIGETEALLRQREVLENRLNAAQQDYNKISQRGRINSVEPTFHYVVVVAKGYDIEQQRGYYRFQEVGVGTENPINGTHNGNRFYIYDDKLKGRQGFSAREYIVTEVRQHRQTGRDCTN
jgi:hypothetical protein